MISWYLFYYSRDLDSSDILLLPIGKGKKEERRGEGSLEMVSLWWKVKLKCN